MHFVVIAAAAAVLIILCYLYRWRSTEWILTDQGGHHWVL